MDLKSPRRSSPLSDAHHGSAASAPRPPLPPGVPAGTALIALSAAIPVTLAVLCTSRDGHHDTHLVEQVYVRAAHNRVIELDVSPQSKVWWATQRALIALGDSRDIAECRLLLNGQPLHPERTLVKSGVHNGDTLDLVNAATIERPRRIRRLSARALSRLGIRKRR